MFKILSIVVLVCALLLVLLISYGLMMRGDDLEKEYGKETVGAGKLIMPAMTATVLLMLYLVSR